VEIKSKKRKEEKTEGEQAIVVAAGVSSSVSKLRNFEKKNWSGQYFLYCFTCL